MNPRDQGFNLPAGKLAVPTFPSFDAFHDRHQLAWVRYAHAETGSRDAAELIVDGLTAHLRDTWPSLERNGKAAQHAWKVLKANSVIFLPVDEIILGCDGIVTDCNTIVTCTFAGPLAYSRRGCKAAAPYQLERT